MPGMIPKFLDLPAYSLVAVPPELSRPDLPTYSLAAVPTELSRLLSTTTVMLLGGNAGL
jgi:hypothetical protein